jgi:hypothetical protein
MKDDRKSFMGEISKFDGKKLSDALRTIGKHGNSSVVASKWFELLRKMNGATSFMLV